MTDALTLLHANEYFSSVSRDLQRNMPNLLKAGLLRATLDAKLDKASKGEKAPEEPAPEETAPEEPARFWGEDDKSKPSASAVVPSDEATFKEGEEEEIADDDVIEE